MSGKLTTHVLDMTQGRPAEGMKVELWRMVTGGEFAFVRSMVTNSDGRLDEPMLAGPEWQAGVYELVFYVAEFFRGQGVDLSDPPFLDRVPLRFGVDDPSAHYHVPLLVAPGGYSTYRGS